eukprot:4680071-Amphidinium_carterae.1
MGDLQSSVVARQASVATSPRPLSMQREPPRETAPPLPPSPMDQLNLRVKQLEDLDRPPRVIEVPRIVEVPKIEVIEKVREVPRYIEVPKIQQVVKEVVVPKDERGQHMKWTPL